MANRCFSLSIQGVLLNSYRENVLHFASTGTNDNDTLAAGESLINGWNTAVKTLWLATLPSAYQMIRQEARRVDLKPSFVSHKEFVAGTANGTRGSDATAQQLCPSVFMVPTMGVKSGGKIFWPCIPQGDIIQSALASAWQTAADAAVAAMITGFTNAGITWTLCVFSRKLKTIANIASHHWSPVVGFQGRRRLPVGGT